MKIGMGAALAVVLWVSEAVGAEEVWIRIRRPMPEVCKGLMAGDTFKVRGTMGEGAERSFTFDVGGKVVAVLAKDVELVDGGLVRVRQGLEGEIAELKKRKGELTVAVAWAEGRERELNQEMAGLRVRLAEAQEEVKRRGSSETWVARATAEEMQEFSLMGRLKQDSVRDLLAKCGKMRVEEFDRLSGDSKSLIAGYGPLRRGYARLGRLAAGEAIGDFVEEVGWEGVADRAVLAFLRGAGCGRMGVVSAEVDKRDADLLVVTVDGRWGRVEAEARGRIEGLVRILWSLGGEARKVEFRE